MCRTLRKNYDALSGDSGSDSSDDSGDTDAEG